MEKRDKPRCAISWLGDNRYLLKGTPHQEAIVDLAAGQDEPFILIKVEDGNIRDLSGSVITIPGGYLVFKRLFEVNKRPAIYLMRDVAQSLLTAAKGSAQVYDDRVLMGGFEFTFPIGKNGFVPVGYISLPNGKKILHMPVNEEAKESEQTPPAEPVSAPAVPVQTTAPADVPVPAHTPETPIEKLVEAPSKALSIINSIASDERNLALIKDAAYTAYSIISKAKNSGAISKEEVAACVMAALSAPETRSALRRIGSAVFRRFTELNKEAGSVVDVKSGYRVTSDSGIIIDEYPDTDMLDSIRAEVSSDVVKAHINYDRSLGYSDGFITSAGADYGYIAKNMLKLNSQYQNCGDVSTFYDRYKNAVTVFANSKDNGFIALILDGQRIYEVSPACTSELFGYFENDDIRFLLYRQDGLIADYMSACPDIYTVKQQYVDCVIDALPNKVIHVTDPHKDDTRALIRRGYSIGTEKKGESWVLWAFPAGKTLNTNGLPKSIVGGVPQY